MGFNLDGTWTSDFYPITDKENDIPISSEKFQTLIQSNLKPSFENCITRDGTGKPTSDISFMSHKITNLGSGVLSTDAINKGQLDTAISVQATESVRGTAKIATEAETLAQSDDTKIITPKKLGAALSGIAFNARFAINKGNADSDGLPDLIDGIGTGLISFKVDDDIEYGPIIGTNAVGGAFSFSSLPDTDISGLADGEYNILLRDDDGTPEIAVYANTIYRQANQPAAMNTNDIWYDTRQPHAAKIKTSTTLVDTTFIPLPQTITIASGVISDINIRGAFNYDGDGYFPLENYSNDSSLTGADTDELKYYSTRLQKDISTNKIRIWCEQGGSLQGDSESQTSVTYPKEFLYRTRYSLTVGFLNISEYDKNDQMAIIYINADGFVFWNREGVSRRRTGWRAEGYLN